MKLPDEVIRFFHKQHYVIVSTVGVDRVPHTACKGIVKISQSGKIYLLDLYKGRTFENLKHNPRISITAVDEHKFKGWCLKGKVKITKGDKLKSNIRDVWTGKIASRITHRLLKNIREEKGHHRHPEAQLPRPEYMIAMEVEEVVDLTPHHVK